VCDFSLAVHLADGFRQILITASQYESANLARQDSAGKVYDYITTGGFAPRLAKVIDWARAEQQVLNKERDYYLGQWAQREQGITDMITNVFTMVGELAAAGAALPPPYGPSSPLLAAWRCLPRHPKAVRYLIA